VRFGRERFAIRLAAFAATVLAIGCSSQRPAAPPTPAEQAVAAPASSPNPAVVDPDTLVRRGIAEIQRGNFEEARALLEAVPRDSEGEALALHNLGVLYDHLGELERARAAFERVVELEPDVTDGWTGLGWARYRTGDYEGSAAASRRAVELKRRSTTAAYNLGLALAAHGDVEGTVAAYRHALDVSAGVGLQSAREELVAHGESDRPQAALALARAYLARVSMDAEVELTELELALARLPAGARRRRVEAYVTGRRGGAAAAGIPSPYAPLE